MTGPALLDLNDSNLQLWHRGQTVQSPGYALLDGKQYTFGSAARGAARLRPRDINTRYWWQLNTEGLQPALGPARHTADLVHAHLLDIHRLAGQPGEIILAVSGSMARDQLALLLGIVEQCPFNAVGLVNRSVALASAVASTGNVYHMEIQLHQAVISELARSAGQLEMRRATPLPGCGLLQLQERLVEIIAAAFVRQTRFDPRRKAESEQQLYNALPAVLAALGKESEANMEVMGYRARIARNELYSAGELLFKSAPEAMGIIQPQDQIIMDPIAGLLPGLMEKFPQAQLIDSKALQLSVDQHLDTLVQVQSGAGEQALHFVTTLPSLTTPDEKLAEEEVKPEQTPPASTAPEPDNEPKRVTATHLLKNAVATALSPGGTALGEMWQLYLEQGSWLLRGTGAIQVNNENYVAGQALNCGDRIDWGTENARDEAGSGVLIAVETP